MTQAINTFLSPLEIIIRKYQKYIGYFLIVLSCASFGFLFYPDSMKDSGGYAINVLWIILWIPIFSRVFGIELAKTLLPLRKELGILMGTLAFAHGAGFMITYPSMVIDPSFWWSSGFLSYAAFGFAALILTIPLALTSSSWAMVTLGKNWKRLHRLAYIIIILAVVHVVLINFYRHFEFGPVILLALYF